MLTYNSTGQMLVGEEAYLEGCRRGAEVKLAVQRGLACDWDDMAKVFNHIFTSELRVDPAVHPMLITEPPLTPRVSAT